MPAQLRVVELITIKRKHIALSGEDKYGHWWFEIGAFGEGEAESYGWWPAEFVGLTSTLLGVPGDLNGQTSFFGSPTRDPRHGDKADEEFYPYVLATDTRTDQEIADCLRRFATSFTGAWRWTFGKGQNCHTFQEQAMRHCRLLKRDHKKWQ